MKNYKKTGVIIIAIILSSICFSLGWWQIKRRAWKESLITHYNQQVKLPSVALEMLKGKSLHRRVEVKGYFLPQKMIFLGSKVQHGKIGYFAFAPLVIDTIEGKFLWVNIGWIDKKARQSLDLLNYPKRSKVLSITGFLTNQLAQRTRYTPTNNIKENEWFWLDIPTMDKSSKLGVLKNFSNIYYLHPSFPLNSEIFKAAYVGYKQHFYNNHLNYIITWFSLGVLIILFALTNIRKF